MKTFFFIPVGKLHKLETLRNNKKIDHLILDLEESLQIEKFENYHSQIAKIPTKEDIWVRPLLRSSFSDPLNINLVFSLIELGFKRFIWPKLINSEELFLLAKETANANLIAMPLIEHPRFLFDLGKVLDQGNYSYVGIGNHDFFAITKSKNNQDNLNYLRRSVLFTAKAFNTFIVDTASMEIDRVEIFTKEIRDAIDIGMDAKFFIHPKQLEIFNNLQYYSKEEIEWARTVIEMVNNQGGVESFIPTLYQGKIVEKPHFQLAMKILKMEGDGIK